MMTSSRIGICSYGIAIPSFRLPVTEVSHAHERICKIEHGLGVASKSVADTDEDAVTLAVCATQKALKNSSIEPTSLQSMYVGSESHPYAVKSSASMIAGMIGMSNQYFAADLEYACKAGTASLQVVLSQLKANDITLGCAIGADTAQSAPGDMLEYTSASGAASFLCAQETDEIPVIATLIDTLSIHSDTPDFWRASHSPYPAHAGRFTGEPAYFKHVLQATQVLLEKTQIKIQDIDHVVFHMPNGKFPQKAAKKMGISKEQLQAGMVVTQLGNTYSACSLIGLAAILDQAKPGEKILMTSYGSGAGADSFLFETTEHIASFSNTSSFLDLQNKTDKISYAHYIRMRQKTVL
jgi:hydroxymethylglutaryl-CoA synthase